MTTEQVEELFNKYREYFQFAESYYKEKEGSTYADIRLDEFGNIQHEVNESCNCHPEYVWEQYATVEQVIEWCQIKNNL